MRRTTRLSPDLDWSHARPSFIAEPSRSMNGQTSLPQLLAILPVLQARFEDLVERLIEREMWDQPCHDLGYSWGKALALHGLAGIGRHLAPASTNSGKTSYELSNLSLLTHKKSLSSAPLILKEKGTPEPVVKRSSALYVGVYAHRAQDERHPTIIPSIYYNIIATKITRDAKISKSINNINT